MTARAHPPWLYRTALWWNLFWGLPLLASPALVARMFGFPLPDTGIAELNARGLGLSIALFGFFYWQIGRNLGAQRNFLLIAAMAKLSAFALASFQLLRFPEIWLLYLIFCGDFLYGALFLRDWRRLAPPDRR